MHQQQARPTDLVSIVFHSLGGSIFTAVVSRRDADEIVQVFAKQQQQQPERITGRCLANNIVFAVNLDEVAIVHQSVIPPEELRRLQGSASPYSRSGN